MTITTIVLVETSPAIGHIFYWMKLSIYQTNHSLYTQDLLTMKDINVLIGLVHST